MPPRKGMTYLKTNCRGCKALKDGVCCLHIHTEQIVDILTNNIIIKPLHPCPKPRTNRKLQEALAAHIKGDGEDPHRSMDLP